MFEIGRQRHIRYHNSHCNRSRQDIEPFGFEGVCRTDGQTIKCTLSFIVTSNFCKLERQHLVVLILTPFSCSGVLRSRPWGKPVPLIKGSRINNRSPQFHRTRSDSSLDLETQQQLLLDFEAFGEEATPSKVAGFCSIYGEPKSKLNITTRTKISYYKSLKRNNPREYW